MIGESIVIITIDLHKMLRQGDFNEPNFLEIF